MKIILFCLIFFLFLSCTTQQQRSSKEQRIISLAPSITEILYALELDEKVVGVTEYCTFPAEVKKKEVVGGLLNPNLEKIASLRPTLILATCSNEQLKTKVSDPNIKIVLLPENSVQDLYFSIDSIAVLNGVQKRAKALISAIQDSLQKYTLHHVSKRPEAILVLGRDPGTTSNIGLSGPGAFINELWEACGGLNAFADMPGSFSQVNREDVLSRNPNIIIEFKTISNWNKSMLKGLKEEWQDLQIDAVKKGNIYVLNGINYLVPGPRIYLLAREYYNILQKYHGLKELG